jgi:hypothetical protein
MIDPSINFNADITFDEWYLETQDGSVESILDDHTQSIEEWEMNLVSGSYGPQIIN